MSAATAVPASLTAANLSTTRVVRPRDVQRSPGPVFRNDTRGLLVPFAEFLPEDEGGYEGVVRLR